MERLGRSSLAILLAALSACSDTLDTADQVHDLRQLAMRADPAEQFVTAVGPQTVTALIADPSGAGRTVHCRWTTCAQVNGDTHRCEVDSEKFAILAELDVQAGPDGAEPSVTYPPDPALLARLVELDPYRGLGGVRQVVQLEIRAGTESVVGFKRVVFSRPPGPSASVNQNPVVGALEFNDAGWAPDASVSFVPRPPRVRGAMQGGAANNQLAVLEDKALLESYTVQTFDGTPRVLQEAWRYSFFASHGGFSPATAGGADILGRDGGLETTWQGTAGDDGGTTTVWVVVRDGRGGESWVVRHAEAPATATNP